MELDHVFILKQMVTGNLLPGETCGPPYASELQVLGKVLMHRFGDIEDG